MMLKASQIVEKFKAKIALFRLAGLYIVQGIPFGFGFESIPTLLRHSGTPLNVLAMAQLIGLPWIINFLWAPFVENHWNGKIGRRRSWILPMQLGLALIFLALAFIPFEPSNAVLILTLVLAASLFSATQDIAVDGLAADSFPAQSLVSANAIQFGGLVFGMLIGGAGVMVVYDMLGLPYTMLILATIVLCLLIPTVFWQEPVRLKKDDVTKAKISVFFRRLHAFWVLWLGLVATLSGTLIYALWRLVLVDFGWSPGQIGIYSIVGYTGFMLIGSVVAPSFIKATSARTTAILGIICASSSGVGWMLLANGTLPPVPVFVGALIGIGAFGTSLASIVIYAAVMRFAQRGSQPATDFTVYQSSHIFTEIALSSLGMSLSVYFGYAAGMSIGIGIGIIAIVTLLKTNTGLLEFKSTSTLEENKEK